MIENTAAVMGWMGLSEGGYVDDKDDPGGPTSHGVTERVWHADLKLRGLPPSDVRNVTKEIANRIFAEQYLAPVWFNRLPSGLDYSVGDYSVNSGPRQSVKDLQRVLNDLGSNIAVDGHMGLATLAAITEYETSVIIIMHCQRRLAFMKKLKVWWKYKNGWTRRVMGEDTGAQDDDIGVIDRSVRLSRYKNKNAIPGPKANPGRATGKPQTGLFDLIALLINSIIRTFTGQTAKA